MASTSQFCRDDHLRRRDDLVIRPITELGLCMVYRPRPARIISLNTSSWLLLQLCDGATATEIEASFVELVLRSGGQASSSEAQRGLVALAEHQLISVVAVTDENAQPKGGRND